MTTYLLDANVFITANRLHYGMDFCPAFWEWVEANNASGRVFSIERVGDEVMALEDELSGWAAKRGEAFFLPTTPSEMAALGTVSTWASGQRYDTSAVDTFLRVADFYLVAQALANKHTVVTHEVPSASLKKIKIPDACIGVGVKYVTPYEMLRREHARFVLGKHSR